MRCHHWQWVALAIKQLPLLREMEGSCLWNTTQLLIKLPVALAILFGTMTIHERMTNSMAHSFCQLNAYIGREGKKMIFR